MAFKLLQTVTSSKTVSTGTTSTAALADTTTGNLVVITANTDKGSTAGITSITCSGMSFAKIDDIADGGGANESLWYAYNITGAVAPTLTINFAAGLIGGAIIREYAGATITDPLDKHITAIGGSSQALSSGATATLTDENELVIGWGGTLDSGNTYTAGTTYANATTLKIGTTLDLGMEDKILIGIPGTQTATFAITNPSFWGCGVATFLIKAIGDSGGYNHLIVSDGMSRSEVAN